MSWNPGSLFRKIEAYKEFTPQEVREYISYDFEEGLFTPTSKYQKRLQKLSLDSIRKFDEIREKYKLPLNKKLRKSRPVAGKELAELVRNYNGNVYRVYSDFFAIEVGAYL